MHEIDLQRGYSIYLFIYLFNHSFIHSFIYLFTYLFIEKRLHSLFLNLLRN